MLLFLGLLSLFTQIISGAQIITVSNSGKDENNCGSDEQPCLTLFFVVSNICDTTDNFKININAGTYAEKPIIIMDKYVSLQGNQELNGKISIANYQPQEIALFNISTGKLIVTSIVFVLTQGSVSNPFVYLNGMGAIVITNSSVQSNPLLETIQTTLFNINQGSTTFANVSFTNFTFNNNALIESQYTVLLNLLQVRFDLIDRINGDDPAIIKVDSSRFYIVNCTFNRCCLNSGKAMINMDNTIGYGQFNGSVFDTSRALEDIIRWNNRIDNQSNEDEIIIRHHWLELIKGTFLICNTKFIGPYKSQSNSQQALLPWAMSDGTILCSSANGYLEIINTSFTHCSAFTQGRGAAITRLEDYITLENCTFEDCIAIIDGESVIPKIQQQTNWVGGAGGIVVLWSENDNSQLLRMSGGAFKDCSAVRYKDIQPILNQEDNQIIERIRAKNKQKNSLNFNDDVIHKIIKRNDNILISPTILGVKYPTNSTIDNVNFTNCYLSTGSVLTLEDNRLSYFIISNSRFSNIVSQQGHGGALIFSGEQGTIINCQFENITSQEAGAILDLGVDTMNILKKVKLVKQLMMMNYYFNENMNTNKDNQFDIDEFEQREDIEMMNKDSIIVDQMKQRLSILTEQVRKSRNDGEMEMNNEFDTQEYQDERINIDRNINKNEKGNRIKERRNKSNEITNLKRKIRQKIIEMGKLSRLFRIYEKQQKILMNNKLYRNIIEKQEDVYINKRQEQINKLQQNQYSNQNNDDTKLENLHIENCNFRNCRATSGQGGVIWIRGAAGFNMNMNMNKDINKDLNDDEDEFIGELVSIYDCEFINCSAYLHGGSIMAVGQRYVNEGLQVRRSINREDQSNSLLNGMQFNLSNCIFIDTHAQLGCGGAIYFGGTGDDMNKQSNYKYDVEQQQQQSIFENDQYQIRALNVTDCSFYGCSCAIDGLSLLCDGINIHVQIIGENIFSDQGSQFASSGALFFDGKRLKVEGAWFRQCILESGDGAAIYVEQVRSQLNILTQQQLLFKDCTFERCRAVYGGAVYTEYPPNVYINDNQDNNQIMNEKEEYGFRKCSFFRCSAYTANCVFFFLDERMRDLNIIFSECHFGYEGLTEVVTDMDDRIKIFGKVDKQDILIDEEEGWNSQDCGNEGIHGEGFGNPNVTFPCYTLSFSSELLPQYKHVQQEQIQLSKIMVKRGIYEETGIMLDYMHVSIIGVDDDLNSQDLDRNADIPEFRFNSSEMKNSVFTIRNNSRVGIKNAKIVAKDSLTFNKPLLYIHSSSHLRLEDVQFAKSSSISVLSGNLLHLSDNSQLTLIEVTFTTLMFPKHGILLVDGDQTITRIINCTFQHIIRTFMGGAVVRVSTTTISSNDDDEQKHKQNHQYALRSNTRTSQSSHLYSIPIQSSSPNSTQQTRIFKPQLYVMGSTFFDCRCVKGDGAGIFFQSDCGFLYVSDSTFSRCQAKRGTGMKMNKEIKRRKERESNNEDKKNEYINDIGDEFGIGSGACIYIEKTTTQYKGGDDQNQTEQYYNTMNNNQHYSISNEFDLNISLVSPRLIIINSRMINSSADDATSGIILTAKECICSFLNSSFKYGPFAQNENKEEYESGFNRESIKQQYNAECPWTATAVGLFRCVAYFTYCNISYSNGGGVRITSEGTNQTENRLYNKIIGISNEPSPASYTSGFLKMSFCNLETNDNLCVFSKVYSRNILVERGATFEYANNFIIDASYNQQQNTNTYSKQNLVSSHSSSKSQSNPYSQPLTAHYITHDSNSYLLELDESSDPPSKQLIQMLPSIKKAHGIRYDHITVNGESIDTTKQKINKQNNQNRKQSNIALPEVEVTIQGDFLSPGTLLYEIYDGSKVNNNEYLTVKQPINHFKYKSSSSSSSSSPSSITGQLYGMHNNNISYTYFSLSDFHPSLKSYRKLQIRLLLTDMNGINDDDEDWDQIWNTNVSQKNRNFDYQLNALSPQQSFFSFQTQSIYLPLKLNSTYLSIVITLSILGSLSAIVAGAAIIIFCYVYQKKRRTREEVNAQDWVDHQLGGYVSVDMTTDNEGIIVEQKPLMQQGYNLDDQSGFTGDIRGIDNDGRVSQSGSEKGNQFSIDQFFSDPAATEDIGNEPSSYGSNQSDYGQYNTEDPGNDAQDQNQQQSFILNPKPVRIQQQDQMQQFIGTQNELLNTPGKIFSPMGRTPAVGAFIRSPSPGQVSSPHMRVGTPTSTTVIGSSPTQSRPFSPTNRTQSPSFKQILQQTPSPTGGPPSLSNYLVEKKNGLTITYPPGMAGFVVAQDQNPKSARKRK